MIHFRNVSSSPKYPCKVIFFAGVVEEWAGGNCYAVRDVLEVGFKTRAGQGEVGLIALAVATLDDERIEEPVLLEFFDLALGAVCANADRMIKTPS
jgi:hypothetical protein